MVLESNIIVVLAARFNGDGIVFDFNTHKNQSPLPKISYSPKHTKFDIYSILFDRIKV